MEEYLSIDLILDPVHQGLIVIAELHPAEFSLGTAGLLAAGRGRLWLGILHGVGDLLQHPERTGLVWRGAAVADLRIVAAARVTLNDRWRLRERSPYGGAGRTGSVASLNFDRDDPDTTGLLQLGWGLLLHPLLLLLLVHHVEMLLLLGRHRLVMLLVDLRRCRRVRDVIVALVDEVVRVGEHRGWCCETTVRVAHG